MFFENVMLVDPSHDPSSNRKCPQLHYDHVTRAAIMPCFHLPVRYFTFPYQDMTLDQEMQLLDQPDKLCHFLAHNGWVMGDDPLRNFAEPGKQDEPQPGTRWFKKTVNNVYVA